VGRGACLAAFIRRLRADDVALQVCDAALSDQEISSIRTREREHSTKTDAAMVPRMASFFEGELRYPRALYAMPAANEYPGQ